jgi:hypothetical protein
MPFCCPNVHQLYALLAPHHFLVQMLFRIKTRKMNSLSTDRGILKARHFLILIALRIYWTENSVCPAVVIQMSPSEPITVLENELYE